VSVKQRTQIASAAEYAAKLLAAYTAMYHGFPHESNWIYCRHSWLIVSRPRPPSMSLSKSRRMATRLLRDFC